MKIKVCGMKFSENISNLVDIGIDYVGFIKWQKSTRFSSNTPKISDSIKKVGVFVDSPISEIKSSIKKNNFDLVQLHGNESIDYCHSLKGSSLIIKAFNIDEKFCFSKLESYDDVCDYFLFDSKGVLPGGNGKKFDWSLLKNYKLEKPFFISGGIGINDIFQVKELIQSNLPVHAIDINSKFENSPGEKNTELIKLFKEKLEL